MGLAIVWVGLAYQTWITIFSDFCFRMVLTFHRHLKNGSILFRFRKDFFSKICVAPITPCFFVRSALCRWLVLNCILAVFQLLGNDGIKACVLIQDFIDIFDNKLTNQSVSNF